MNHPLVSIIAASHNRVGRVSSFLCFVLVLLIILIQLPGCAATTNPCEDAPRGVTSGSECFIIDKELILASNPETQAVFDKYLNQPGNHMYLLARLRFWTECENKTCVHIYGYHIWDGEKWVDYGVTTEIWLTGVFDRD